MIAVADTAVDLVVDIVQPSENDITLTEGDSIYFYRIVHSIGCFDRNSFLGF